MTMSNIIVGQFGDTTLTKVFVGGLAWETQNEVLREFFEKYGEILEAVIISDKITGRSKGYGFVTFKEAEAAKKACEDPTPVINGRRANCNLASLGARRLRSSSTPQGCNVGPRSTSSSPAANQQVQWYYPTPTGTPANTPFHHQHQPAIPFHAYSYSPTYIATDHMGYNPKLSYSTNGGGSYYTGVQYAAAAAGQGMINTNSMIPMYPLYHFNRPQTMGTVVPHIYPYSTTAAGPVTTIPAVISKPPAMAPNTVCLGVK